MYKQLLNKHITLCGMMGSGKSAVGRRLAEKLNTRFTDLDAYIQLQENRTISEVFDLYGEQEFRRIEKRCLERLLGSDPHVIALGGGTLNSAERVQKVRKYSTLCFIDAPFTLILERVQRNTRRPLLTDESGQLKPEDEIVRILRNLFDKREPLYRMADVRIRPLENASIDETTELLISNLEQHARQADHPHSPE